MKAAIINKYGLPEVFEMAEVDKPTIGPDEILVEVHASSVNPVDWKIRNGSLKILIKNRFPKILGADVAGVVTERGANVTLYNPGDEVFGKLNAFRGGAYAEFVSLRPNQVNLKPKNINFLEAASLPLVGLTAIQSLLDIGGLKKGKRVCINGASGGVGLLGVQFCRALNARITAICSEKNASIVKELGADEVIDYQQTGLHQLEGNYDIFFDAVAKSNFGTVKRILDKKGVFVTTLPDFYVMILAPVVNVFGGKKAEHVMVKSNPTQLKLIKEMTEAGDIVPVIDKTFNLSEISNAHIESEKGRTVGKIAINIKD